MHTKTPLFHLTVCILFTLTFFITTTYASPRQEISVFEAIQRIKISNHPAIEEQKLDIDAAEVQIDKVQGTFYSPRVQLESYGGVVSDAEGTVTNTLDRNDDTDDLGPFFKIGLKIIQPLYSFGKYGNAEKAAGKNLEVHKAIYQESLNSLSLEAIRAYIGVTTGRKAVQISDELKDRYQSLIKHIKQLIEEQYSGSMGLQFVYNANYLLSNGLSVLAARDHVGEHFILCMADHILGDDLLHMARSYTPSSGSAALLVDYKINSIFDLDDATKVYAENGKVVHIGKQLSHYNCVDTGLFVCSRAIFHPLARVYEDKGDASLSDGVQELCENRKMFALDIKNGFWQDVDTIDMLEYAEKQLSLRIQG